MIQFSLMVELPAVNRQGLGSNPRAGVGEQVKYDYSTNMTVTELKRMLEYAEAANVQCIGVHFKNEQPISRIKVSDTGPGWRDYKSHVCVTDWASA